MDSTNEEAKRLIRDGRIVEPAYVLAREQTDGKGSRGRSWSSPKDAGIYVSIVDFPHVQPGRPLTLFTLAAAVACVEALEHAAGIRAQLKPVNDVYVDGCKLAGILTESLIQGDQVEAIVTGIGLNLTQVPRAAAENAISLESMMAAESFRGLDRELLVAQLAAGVRRWSARAEADALAVREAWEHWKIPGTCLPDDNL